jgi:uncharacterized protein (TIGR02246 family)
MLRHIVLLPVIAILAAVPLARAAEKTAGSPQAGEIHKAITSLEDAFNRGDAKGVAACWTPNGEFLGPRGERIEGREKIEAAFGELLANHQNSKLRISVASVRLVTDDVATVDAISKMTPAIADLGGEPCSSMVLVKRDGHWLIDSVRETLKNLPSHANHLKDLQWMVGDWTREDPSGATMRSTCDWTAQGSYLIRKFTTEGKKGVLLAGTEVIGWDPRARRIRSWTFDADGGFGESTWTRDGNRWIIKHTGTAADGGDVSVTHIVTAADASTLTLQSKDRIANGAKQPDMPEVTIKRCPAPGGTKSLPNEPAKLPRHVLP